MGSASGKHWLLQRTPKSRGAVPAEIIERAHDVMHRGGAEVLTMRRLAKELHTSPAHLYRHIPSKEWLLIAIADYVLDAVEIVDPRDDDWREGLWSLSRSLRQVLTEHPHLHPVLASIVPVTPSTVKLAKSGLGLLNRAGLDGSARVDAYNAWMGYVVGFTMLEVKPPEARTDSELLQALDETASGALPPEAGDTLEHQDRARVFGLSTADPRLTTREASFEWGLTALMTAMEAGEPLQG